MLRTLIAFASLCAVAGVARADAPAPPFTITTIDEFERLDDNHYSITGLVSGESTPRVMALHSGNSGNSTNTKSADACERAALLMVTHPGRYTVGISINSSVGGGAITCRLVRQNP